jgi:hypothetical protein
MGALAMTSRAMSGHASPVIVWNRVNSVVSSPPKYLGEMSPNSLVPITAAT